tara:strand:+ start:71 stop:1840 length:1770 start_codon:yes stop_codon:yes gene_type:complete
MCGIFTVSSIEKDLQEINIEKIRSSLFKRGPDSFGYTFLNQNQTLFAHSRLSIQDLSDSANQPMSRENSPFTIVFNGEIYNHFELRNKYLNSVDFFTDSDTETILSLLDSLGINKTLSLLDGMISIVIYSKTNNRIYFYRDLSGQKPLFYYFHPQKHKLSISSSPSLFYKCTNYFRKEFDSYLLNQYISNGFVDTGYSIYKGLFNCVPGILYSFNNNDLVVNKTFINKPGQESLNTFIENISEEDSFKIFTKSIQSSLIGARKCGVLLSGGVDSTAVAIACSEASIIERAYTLTYPNVLDLELKQASTTARSLKYEHIVVNLDIEKCCDISLELASIIDYPNPDPSILPTTLISEIASHNDTILLTGDGGDEIFGGYNRYRHFVSRYSFLFDISPSYIKKKILLKYLSNFHTHLSKSKSSQRVLLDVLKLGENDLLNSMCILDQSLYMIHHTLPKADRALMFNSMEGRAPLLNNEIRALGQFYRNADKGKCEKSFLRSYIKKRMGSAYSNNLKRGFSADIHKLMKNAEFFSTIRASIDQLRDYFESSECCVDNKYLSRLLESRGNVNKPEARDLWLLHGIASCDLYYSL